MKYSTHFKYAKIGAFWVAGVHILFYLGSVSAVGFYVGDLIPLMIRIIPFCALAGLLFFSIGFLKSARLRVCVTFILLPLVFAAVVYSF